MEAIVGRLCRAERPSRALHGYCNLVEPRVDIDRVLKLLLPPIPDRARASVGVGARCELA
jgi:hypothetical protein